MLFFTSFALANIHGGHPSSSNHQCILSLLYIKLFMTTFFYNLIFTIKSRKTSFDPIKTLILSTFFHCQTLNNLNR